MQKGITWTIKLHDYNCDVKKDWIVTVDIKNEDTGETDRIQSRAGINRYKTAKERLAKGSAISEVWERKLKSGWHRFDIKEETKVVNKLDELNSLTLSSALDWVIKNHHCQPATIKAYRLVVRWVKTAAAKPELLFSKIPIAQITSQHILLLMDEVKAARKWSNKAYNRNSGYLCAVFSFLKAKKIILTNPALDISRKPTVQTMKYLPYTETEKKIISEHLYKTNPRFLVYWLLIYFTGIRPAELLALKIKDVDFETKLITIYPDLVEENSKNKKIRYVPISDALLPYLDFLKLDSYPSHFYIFSSPYAPGTGCKGSFGRHPSGSHHADYFKPNEVRIKRDTATRYWQTEVKEKLQIDKYMYSAKRSGANAMILAGIDLESLKEIYGHSSTMMTRIYADQITAVHHKSIISKTPSFLQDDTLPRLVHS